MKQIEMFSHWTNKPAAEIWFTDGSQVSTNINALRKRLKRRGLQLTDFQRVLVEEFNEDTLNTYKPKVLEMFSIWQKKMFPSVDSNQTCEVWFKGITDSTSMSYQSLRPLLVGLEVELVMEEPMNDDVLFTYKVIQPRLSKN